MTETFHRCPSCGWLGLDAPAYENLPALPVDPSILPPYEDHFGRATYDVCLCCGFEYGFDDNPGGGSKGNTFESYLREWIADGCPWFEPNRCPPDWSLDSQLAAANLRRPT